MMFFVVGVIYDRAHHRTLSRFGGIATTMPVYTGFSTVACMANLGLPGLCGFVGEVMVLIGSFQAARPGSILYEKFAAMGPDALNGYRSAVMTLSVISCFGVILTAGYMLWTIQRVFFGPEKSEYVGFPEVDQREVSVLAPLTAMAVLLGILPWVFFFVFTQPTVNALFGLFRPAANAVAGM
jgi:NADH-quinone oxidoreductase subunit M